MSRDRTETRLETPNTAIITKVVYLFRICPYKLVDLCKWSAFVNNRTMRDNCSAAPRLQHCVEITSVSFTVSAVLSRSRLGLEGNCLGLVLVSADSENKCLCLVSVSNTNCLVSVSSRLKLSRTQLNVLNRRPFGRFSASSFCDFFLWPLAISPHFSLFWQKQPFDFWDVLHEENYSLSVSKYD